MANFLMSPRMAGMLENITDVIRHGGALPSNHGALEPENPMWVEFARSMAPMMHMPAELIAEDVRRFEAHQSTRYFGRPWPVRNRIRASTTRTPR